MRPLYLARIEDLGRGDLVKVDCAACHHVALLTSEFFLRLGLSPTAKVLDLKTRVRCRGAVQGGKPSCRLSGGARVGNRSRPLLVVKISRMVPPAERPLGVGRGPSLRVLRWT